MMRDDPLHDWRCLLMELGLTALFNTIIAALLTYFSGRTSFGNYLIVSQAIGLCICLLCQAGSRLRLKQAPWARLTIFTGSVLIGSVLGGSLGGWLTGLHLIDLFNGQSVTFNTLLLSLLFSSVIVSFFLSRRTLAATRELVQQERIQRLTSEKLAAQAQLKMLQAQIEPHFLFNTLSNVLSLLDTDVARGKSMLTDLTLFLRASLAATRAPWTTLGGELELAIAYLNLLKIRMGHRLTVRCEVADDLKQIPFAPMLLQPLIENAVLHGIDPQVEGGSIHILAQRDGETLRVMVTDTGRGFGEQPATGLGIGNIRERLNTLYGQTARLLFLENSPRGVRAVIEVPYASNP